MRLNKGPVPDHFTHEGAPAKAIDDVAQLRRSVMSCLLWEKEFYEDGIDIATRITETAAKVSPTVLSHLAIEARRDYHLRHVPLLLCSVLAKTGSGTNLPSETIYKVVERADELAELTAIYWRDGKRPLSAQMKKGLARAFTKFDAYQLAKYDRANAVRLRDVMFMVHPKPEGELQHVLFKQLADQILASPDTWEVGLSTGGDKKETFTRLLTENKLGYLALLRNLRNMVDANVDLSLIEDTIIARGGAHNVLPFRYVAAARAVLQLEPVINIALLAAIGEMKPLTGKTIVLVDVSGSMDCQMSNRSQLSRMDAAATLASIIPGDLRVFTFSHNVVEVPPRLGMAGIDAVINSQLHGGTYLGAAVKHVNTLPHDRLIVITDEQSHDPVGNPVAKYAYMINVASNKNGIGYRRWTHIDGFSEQVLRFIAELEAP